MTWDAIVIGAGPAGSVTARELVRGGLRVLVVDKSTFPRPKVCGCCLNAAAIGTLKQLGLGHVLANGVSLNAVRIASGRRSAQVKLPGGVALSREAFDSALVNEAVNAGVELQDGMCAKLGDCSPHSRKVLVGNQSVSTRIAIVASGLSGSDATPEAHSRIGAGVAIPPEAVPEFFVPGTIFMATARGGYVGLVRVEDDRLDVAACFDLAFVKSHGGPGPAAEAVVSEVGWPKIPGLAELPWKGTPALTRRAKTVAGERWFAIGDAAGYVEPFTGEGMAWAVMSAAEVAPIAIRATRQWNDLLAREWEMVHHRVIGKRQRTCRVVSRVLRSSFLTSAAVRVLSVFPVLSRPVVASLNRPALPRGATA